jgi:hypothetical protein
MLNRNAPSITTRKQRSKPAKSLCSCDFRSFGQVSGCFRPASTEAIWNPGQMKVRCFNYDGFVKSPNLVTPAKAGVQKLLK